MKVEFDVDSPIKCPFREHDMEDCKYPDKYCCECEEGDLFPTNCPLVKLFNK